MGSDGISMTIDRGLHSLLSRNYRKANNARIAISATNGSVRRVNHPEVPLQPIGHQHHRKQQVEDGELIMPPFQPHNPPGVLANLKSILPPPLPPPKTVVNIEKSKPNRRPSFSSSSSSSRQLRPKSPILKTHPSLDIPPSMKVRLQMRSTNSGRRGYVLANKSVNESIAFASPKMKQRPKKDQLSPKQPTSNSREKSSQHACPVCERIFVTEHYLDSHLKSYHNLQAGRAANMSDICSHCLRHVPKPQQINHYNNCIPVSKPTTQAAAADKPSFSDNSRTPDLQKQNVLNGIPVQKPTEYFCKLCSKKFLNLPFLQQHLNQHAAALDALFR